MTTAEGEIFRDAEITRNIETRRVGSADWSMRSREYRCVYSQIERAILTSEAKCHGVVLRGSLKRHMLLYVTSHEIDAKCSTLQRDPCGTQIARVLHLADVEIDECPNRAIDDATLILRLITSN